MGESWIYGDFPQFGDALLPTASVTREPLEKPSQAKGSHCSVWLQTKKHPHALSFGPLDTEDGDRHGVAWGSQEHAGVWFVELAQKHP